MGIALADQCGRFVVVDLNWGELSPHDAAYIYFGRSATTSTVLSCSVIAAEDGNPLNITVSEVIEYLQRRLHISDMFTARLVRLPGDIAMPYWTRERHRDLAEHITVHAAGLTWTSVQQVLSSLADAPVRTDRPLWSLDVVPDIPDYPHTDGMVTVVAIRLHHAAIDGVSMATVLSAICRDDITPETLHRLLPPREHPRHRHLMRAVARVPLSWTRFAIAIGTTMGTKGESTSLPVRKQWPITRFNTGFTGPRTTTVFEMDLEDVRAMKRTVPGATVNTVLLSVIGDAVIRYLDEHGEHPPRLSALAPMSTRAIAGTRDAPSRGSNQFTPLVIDLAVDETDPTLRLQQITHASNEEKSRAAVHTSDRNGPLLETAPPALLRLLGALTRRQHRRRPTPAAAIANIVVSNVYNPNPSRTVFGHRIVSGFGIQPLTPLSTLAHAASTRDDNISISITTDRAVMPDLDRYRQILHTTYLDHRNALLGDQRNRAM